MEGFNHIWYKDCFYMALFQMLDFPERMFILSNELSYPHYSLNDRIPLIKSEKNIIGNISNILSYIGYSCEGMFPVKSIDSIKWYIDSGYYIILTVDPYYLSVRQDSYHKRHLAHCILVFGYEESDFLVIDQDYSFSLSYNVKRVDSREVIIASQSFHRQLDSKAFATDSFPVECMIDNRLPILFKIRKDKARLANLQTFHDNFFVGNLPKVVESAKSLASHYSIFLRGYLSNDINEKTGIIDIIHKIILSRRVDYYRFSNLEVNLGINGFLHQAISKWEYLRAIFSKSLYKGSIDSYLRIQETLQVISQLERIYYSKVYQYYKQR